MDERSRNGTFVDGERLGAGDAVALTDGSVLRMGRTLLVYREHPERTEPAPPLDRLVGPWGLTAVRRSLGQLHPQGIRNVLLVGETGTGKELVAEAVAQGFRCRKNFGVVNMSALASGVFEAHLFGWKKGAFSGSGEGGNGFFASHNGGAVFLDEIGELPFELQPKLLRLLENGEAQAVGEAVPKRVDVKIVAATNQDLTKLMGEGRFRRDLLARFERTIHLPPLRERPEDIFAIASELAKRENAPLDVKQVEVEAVERLMLHDWPGNIRDLRSLMLSLDPRGVLSLRAVEQVLGNGGASRRVALTREAIERALAQCGGNESAAARALGVSRPRFIRAKNRLISR
jgi:transcriptional regulator with PAS, ATPase and Fis domain